MTAPTSPTSSESRPTTGDLVIRNAAQILTLEGDSVGIVEKGVIVCGQGLILSIKNETAPELSTAVAPDALVIDAEGGIVTPGLIDPHTHPVFAGSRHLEFGMKAQGKSYMEIHKAGGGILSTVRSTRAASRQELEVQCQDNLRRLLNFGVTTIEGKSGYALELEGEIRLLEVLCDLGQKQPVDIVPTLLAAHALPPEFKKNRAGYVQLIIDEMIPQVASKKLARYIDAYCEEGAFTVEEVRKIFEAGQAAGLGIRLHAEQFSDQGGAKMAARLGAASADHLEAIDRAAIKAMAEANTVAVILPGAALSCRCPWPPVREIIDAGVTVALGTDLNPGSSMTSNLPLQMSLACMQLKMSCEEAWRAVTINAARSLGLTDRGKLAPSCLADLVIWNAPDYRYIPYHYGENYAKVVIKKGKIVVDKRS